MRIGIFGGSFNPPHKMHEEICKYFRQEHLLDKIIIVPTGNKYKYKNNLAPDIDRFNMVKIIVDRYDYMEVSDYEFKREVVYTYQTLDYFKSLYPSDEIYFICGLDNLSYIDEWKNSEYLLTNYKFLVIRRNTDDLDKVLNKLEKYQDNIVIVDMEAKDISSTMIRKKIKNKQNTSELDDEVYAYIKKNKLYNDN